MLIWADYKEGKRKGQLVQSPSILESLVGYIEIDDSLNKSGVDTSMHDYPKFFPIPSRLFIMMIHLFREDFIREIPLCLSLNPL